MTYVFDGSNYTIQPRPADIKRVFVDSKDTYLKNREVSQREYSNEKNVVKDKNIFIDILPGYDYQESKRNNKERIECPLNVILRNKHFIEISDNEEAHINSEGQQKIFPYYDYDEDDSIKRKNRAVGIRFKSPIGLNNSSEYVSYKSLKFKDISDKIEYLINSIHSSDT